MHADDVIAWITAPGELTIEEASRHPLADPMRQPSAEPADAPTFIDGLAGLAPPLSSCGKARGSLGCAGFGCPLRRPPGAGPTSLGPRPLPPSALPALAGDRSGLGDS